MESKLESVVTSIVDRQDAYQLKTTARFENIRKASKYSQNILLTTLQDLNYNQRLPKLLSHWRKAIFQPTLLKIIFHQKVDLNPLSLIVSTQNMLLQALILRMVILLYQMTPFLIKVESLSHQLAPASL